ncbi:sulfatase [Tamlana fucoidanivorans]|uniref:Sulfatase n=1 Tax=Allotamlana fucoidanivorans TaxID=2583814 RepID=A0A5C4SE58_9FLAO|nr:sulfatase [Tamlana fucoidanivorans]TNJ41540.1 sulfatase [Tamlana fucoidanivorans]
MLVKKLLYHFSLSFIALIAACQSKKKAPHEAAKTTDKPNIVLIIADDVSWNDIGVYGHPHIKTPNLNRLAQDGMLFTEAFLTTSSCSPSRTSIISGLYPHNTDAEQLSWPLPEGKKTFVQALKANGYWTGLAGKYHLGDPVRNDFNALFEMQWIDAPIGLDRRLVGDGSGCDEWVKLLKERPKDKPFFTWLASFDAHRPFYDDGSCPSVHNENDVQLPPYMPDTDLVKKDFALYYDEIARMDSYIGHVVKELEAQGVAENTVILFIADNGRAFPRDKTTLYDGGIKTPWIVKWPAKIKAGTVNSNLVSSVDIAPTIMSLAGLTPFKEFEGYDFSSMLLDTSKEIRDQIYAEDHFHDFEDYTRAIRTKAYKYVKNFYEDLPNTPSADIIRGRSWQSMLEEYEEGTLNETQLKCFIKPREKEELFDIINDPDELHNIASNVEYAEVLADMRARLKETRSQTKDFLPKRRTPDDFFRETGLPTKYRIRPRPSKAEYMKAAQEGRVLMNPDFKEN